MRFLVAPAIALVATTRAAPPTTAQAETAILQHAIIRPGGIRPITKRLPAMLPPAEYDRPYEGTLILIRAQDEGEVRRLCPGAVFPSYALGCARPAGDSCTIILAPAERIEAAGWTVEIVMRHERSHCVGWPANHPGARTLEEARGR